jgi:hypothetical protein
MTAPSPTEFQQLVHDKRGVWQHAPLLLWSRMPWLDWIESGCRAGGSRVQNKIAMDSAADSAAIAPRSTDLTHLRLTGSAESTFVMG